MTTNRAILKAEEPVPIRRDLRIRIKARDATMTNVLPKFLLKRIKVVSEGSEGLGLQELIYNIFSK